jgi:CIC family chloride channel protein
VVSAVIHLAETQKSELVIWGASRDSLLKQAWYGNIPEAIASKLDTTVIIIRLPSWQKMEIKWILAYNLISI